MLKARIAGIGISLPEKVLTNSELEKMVETTDEWIRTRTGISERRIVPENSSDKASDLGAAACRKALEAAGTSASEVDQIICGPFTPDFSFPSTACLIQEKIGAVNAAGYDISAACAGFLYGLTIADSMIRSGQVRCILVVGSEIISRVVDWTDRNTCVLFGDGAGAALVRAEEGSCGVLASYMKTDGALGSILSLPIGESKRVIQMNGGDVFKHAVRRMTEASLLVLEKAGLNMDDVDCFVTHQANIRIIQATGEQLKIPKEKVFINVEKYGNTSAASVPLALKEAQDQGLIRPGKIILMAAVGGGMAWGATAVRW